MSSRKLTDVRDLVANGVLERPMDGNHGEIHPKSVDFKTSGIPFIMASDLIEGRVDLEHCNFLDPIQAKNLRKGFSRTGDVLLSHKATLGRTALVGELRSSYIMLTPQVTYYRVLDDNVLDRRYLRYYFESRDFQNALTALGGGGSTRAYVGITEQLRLPVVVLPILEQRAIASILGALDDKIELNRKMSATLEAMAQALFKSWFIDFEPVRAKAERRHTSLSAEIDALFPAALEIADHGLLPSGWHWLAASQVLDVNPPRSLSGVKIAPYFDMASVPTQGFAVRNVIDREVSSGSRFANGDTLLARITPCLENGKTTFVDFLNDKVAWGSTEFIVMRPRKPLPAEYGYLLARNMKFREFVIGKMTGSSGRQRVPVDALDSYFLALPSDAVAKAFGNVVKPLFKRITHANLECRTLAAIRDALLPKLISGELRVSEAQPILEKSA